MQKRPHHDGAPLKGAVLHEKVPLLEVADPALLEMLYADRKTAKWLVARLSDRVAVIRPGMQDKLVDAIRRQGHLPKVLDT